MSVFAYTERLDFVEIKCNITIKLEHILSNSTNIILKTFFFVSLYYRISVEISTIRSDSEPFIIVHVSPTIYFTYDDRPGRI